MTEFVLRLHCPAHIDQVVVEFLVNTDTLPRVTWPGEINRHELGDAGWGSTLDESVIKSYCKRPPIVAQWVEGPIWRAPWPPPNVGGDVIWDESRGVAYKSDRPEAGQYSDPNGDGLHLRYVVRCPKPSCSYGDAAVTRPRLLAVLTALHARRDKLAAEVAVLQAAKVALHWRVRHHEIERDTEQGQRTPWTDDELVRGHREWPPTPVLDADLDELLRVVPAG